MLMSVWLTGRRNGRAAQGKLRDGGGGGEVDAARGGGRGRGRARRKTLRERQGKGAEMEEDILRKKQWRSHKGGGMGKGTTEI